MPGFGAVQPSELTSPSWAEYGGRVGYKITPHATIDIFADGASGGAANRDACSCRSRVPLHLLIEERTHAAFAPWRLTRAAELAAIVRDGATSRLRKVLPEKAGEIERALIGRNANEADKATRVRITPLPSIGHSQTDRAIRRVLVEIPPNCAISAADLAWSFSGLDLGIDHETGEVLRQGMPILSTAEDSGMLGHYGIGEWPGARVWRTVTPAALPQGAARRMKACPSSAAHG